MRKRGQVDGEGETEGDREYRGGCDGGGQG